MYSRILVLIAFAIAVATVLLALRQRRTDVTSQIVRLQVEMEQNRYGLWEHRDQIAQRTNPTTLQAAITRNGLARVPIVHTETGSGPALATTQAGAEGMSDRAR